MSGLLVLPYLLAALAHADEPSVEPGPGFDAHGFLPAAVRPDPRGPVTLQRPAEDRQGRFFAGGLMEYAKAPLVAHTPDGEPLPLVDDLVALNTSVGVTAHERVRLDIAAPVYLASRGLEGAQGVLFGDVRLASMITVLAPSDTPAPLSVAVVPWLDLPTGDDARFLGQSALAGGALVAGSVEIEALTITANLGSQFNPSIDRGNLTGADGLIAGLGVGWLIDDHLGVSGEVRGLAPLQPTTPRGTGGPVEALASVRHVRSDGGHFLGGVAAGMSPGIGSAAFRLFVGGGFGTPADLDGARREARHDPCAREILGLLDPERCPDVGPVFTVRALVGDEPVDGAQITITGAETRTFTSATAGLSWRVARDSLWKVGVERGACLSGEQIVQVRDDDLTIDVPLVFVPAALIKVTAVDSSGARLPGAVATFESADPACVPAEPVPVPTHGALLQDVGVGAHTVRVEAPGFVGQELVVDVELGEEREVEVVIAR